MIPIYDTITYTNAEGKNIDSLTLSDDEKAERIAWPDPGLLSEGSQDRHSYSLKLFYWRDRLYGIDKRGKLHKKGVRGLGNSKKWPPRFFKVSP